MLISMREVTRRYRGSCDRRCYHYFVMDSNGHTTSIPIPSMQVVDLKCGRDNSHVLVGNRYIYIYI